MMGYVKKRSYFGNVIYSNDDLVARFTHKKPIVDVSSIKVRYVFVSDACKEGLNVYHFLS